jgi:hypothetical protein
LSEAQKHPIDIVVAWVDGTDPKLKAKRERYLSSYSFLPAGAEPTRFHSLNEVLFCLLSIFKFAPFVRNVFIVTDEQDPKIDQLINIYYPERLKSIRIIDHKEIFKDYETYLPTFNSICISNMLWRIKDLSDQFVYFNDDLFLLRPVNPRDWFIQGRPVLRGKWSLPPYERLLWDSIKQLFKKVVVSNRKYDLSPSFQVNQWNAAKLLGFRWRYFRSGHTPLPLDKKTLENYFTTYPEQLKKNISYRFRHYAQFNTVALANHLELSNGNHYLAAPQAIYIQPHHRHQAYIDQKFDQAQSDEKLLFGCIQSLDLASKKEQEKVLQRLKALLNLTHI